jgi:hypothetical protein
MSYFATCPACERQNPLTIPIEIPSHCIACFQVFIPHCSDCDQPFPQGCLCIPPIPAPVTGDYEDWQVTTEVNPIDIPELAIPRTITYDQPLIALDTYEQEAFDELRMYKDYASPIEKCRDILLLYLVEAVNRIENLISAGCVDVIKQDKDKKLAIS